MSNDLNNFRVTIVEAVRATSAATSFFEPITLGRESNKRTFCDGGLRLNNPAEAIWSENQTILHDAAELSNMTKCFVSVGTGKPGTNRVHNSAWSFFTETLRSIATDTEAVAKEFPKSHRTLFRNGRYYRFNVEQGLQNVGLEEYGEVPTIAAATAEYMDGGEIGTAAEYCALNLKMKDCRLEDFA